MQHGPAHHLSHLRHHGVAERPHSVHSSVHPSGNPISHSTNRGWRRPPTRSGSEQARRRVCWLGLPLRQSRARGVGQYENSLAPVGRAGVGSAHHERPAGVTQRFQPGADPVRAADAQSRAVLSHHPTGSQLGDEALHLVPEDTAGAVKSAALPGRADILAGKPAADEVGSVDAVRAQALDIEPAHIVVERDAGPVPGEDAAAPEVSLAEGDSLHSRPVQAEAEAADAAEQVKDAHGRGSEAWCRRYGFQPAAVKQ